MACSMVGRWKFINYDFKNYFVVTLVIQICNGHSRVMDLSYPLPSVPILLLGCYCYLPKGCLTRAVHYNHVHIKSRVHNIPWTLDKMHIEADMYICVMVKNLH